jgi:L,D-peptidoglycan transpeptidase YkuD (ErfK/YbiS/YcfS/YnhG family)
MLNLYLTSSWVCGDVEAVRRLLISLCAVVAGLVHLTQASPVARAELLPWFAAGVGAATQVISVVGVGGSDAKLDVYEKTAAGWQAVAAGIPAHVGSAGMAPQTHDGQMKTPMGVFTLDFAFGTAPNPGGGLQYVQVGPDHWWDGDMKSPTYNTMQVCKKAQCPFDTNPSSGTENLQIPQYEHAVVMGVNKQRVPGNGGAFFLHTTDGGPTAGCVSIDDATLVGIIKWLRPGALIAVSK